MDAPFLHVARNVIKIIAKFSCKENVKLVKYGKIITEMKIQNKTLFTIVLMKHSYKIMFPQLI